MEQDFAHTILGKTGLQDHRLGFSATYRPGLETVRRAYEAGLNLFFSTAFDSQIYKFMRELSPSDRQGIYFASGALKLAGWRPNLRRTLEKRLKQLGTDYLDIFLFMAIDSESEYSDEVRSELERFRQEGKVRFVGVSSHDRKLLGKLAAEDSLDLLMLRYNAAHRGAEDDIFPHLRKPNPDSHMISMNTRLGL